MNQTAETKAIVAGTQFQKRGLTLVHAASKITINSPDTYRRAIEFGQGVSTLISEIENFFRPLKKKAKEAHTALCDEEKKALSVPRQADDIVSSAIRVYRQEQLRIAEEEAEAEREKLRKQAEQERKEAAAELRKAGMRAEAKMIMAEAIAEPVVEAKIEVPKMSGVRVRKEWHFEIVDPKLIERRFLVPDSKLIRAEVMSRKETAVEGGSNPINGVRVWCTEETDY